MKLNEIKDITGEKIKMSDIKDRHAKLAKKLGLKQANLDSLSDKEIQVIIQNIGKHDFVDESKFSKSEIEKSIRVEYEHCNSKLVAKLIALDHLDEMPNYYTELEKMEKKFQ